MLNSHYAKVALPNPEDYPDPFATPWKSNRSRRYNCYDFAINYAGNYSQPGDYGQGRLSRQFLAQASHAWKNIVAAPAAPKWLKPRARSVFNQTVKGAVSDGLIPVREPCSSKGFRLVSLQFILSPGEIGHHWARYNNNGRLTDKNGNASIRNVEDADGFPVLFPHESFKPDERSLKRFDCHYMFGGYFLSPAKFEDLGALPFENEPMPLVSIA